MAKKNRAGFLEKALQEFRWSFIITALVFIALGLLLILRPNLARELLAYAVGGALAVYGLFNILSFLFAKDRTLSFELVIGVITAAVGIFILASPGTVLNIIQIVLGLAIIIDSLLGIKRAFTLRELGLGSWGAILSLSILTSILGILFVMHQDLFGSALMVVIGIVLLYQGVSDLITVIRISVIGNRMKKNLELSVRDEIVLDPDGDR
ncbi:MAG TPA: DUF308 domain-containing protein [Candidatus Faecousia faecigallinarum]|nr:DUF308 domain-containing protein [Candidatus Faecousia faecigallinarum]